MLNTELYKVFYYVAKHKNISKAAQSLYISQPAVSKSIKNLEEATKCTLFKRSSKGVSLTSEGEILFDYVEKAFVNLLNGEKIIEKISYMEEGLVKIGISNTLCKYFFLPHLHQLHKTYPNIKIQIVNRPSPKTLELLDEGKIDFGIISIYNEKSDYEYIPLMQIQDFFVAMDNYYQEKIITLDNLAKLPLMVMEKENQTRIYVDNFLAENGVTINPEIEIGSMDFLVEFAKIGIGVACVIKEFVKDELKNGTLKEIQINKKPKPREIGLVMKKNIPLSLAARRFIEQLSKK